ncbi:glycosyltransferase family 4 protein [Thermodesulfatator autotrophicus]|uniref:Glycosyl transferase family 1 n=1 Tax=Thermodesulfatator autotrophicus TaxID=1795632 RepID=A0A177E6V7_9BACT|nr:glycosyltransferase family 4 protein [Thermodesulfatator autotrophicus]OAG27674.1 hypothetical protein TH606_05615 [Thermodesulfatator autotrophicus]
MTTNKRSKILHTESAYGWGGQERRIIVEIQGLIDRGYWVALAAPEDSPIFNQAKKQKIPVFNLPFKKRNLANIYQLMKIIINEKINILNTHSSWDSWMGGIAKLLYPKFKLVRTRHLSTDIGRNPSTKLIYDILPDKIITTGEAIRQKMISYNKFNPEKIVSIPTGVDLKKFNFNKVNPLLKEDSFIIGTVSVLRSWKGHKYLIKAIPKILSFIPDLKLYIVGDGPQRKNLENLCEELKLEKYVIFLGYREDIPELIASFDILVHPSTGHEGVPQTILQALAMKKPVIACDTGSIGEVIKNQKTGILIPPKDIDSLAKAIINFYENPDLARIMAENGYNLVSKKYSLNSMIDQIEEVYLSLVS